MKLRLIHIWHMLNRDNQILLDNDDAFNNTFDHKIESE